MNKTADYELTIIVPVFNEEDNLHRLEERLSAFLPGSSRKACVLFVDDGSKDGSLSGIKDICSRHQDFFYAGFDYAESGLVGYIDADLQTEPEEFNLLLQAIDGYSMVIGIRTGRKDSWFKKAQSKIANGFRRMMTHDGAVDTGCPLKVIHTDVAKRIPMFKGMHRFLPALVLLQEGTSYKQVSVRHFPRVAGKSKYHLWNRLWGPLADCFVYRWMKRRYLNFRVAESNID